MELTNKKVGMDMVHMTRYIASWYIVGGERHFGFDREFVAWLKAEGLTDDEATECKRMATMGKFELESDARTFVETLIERNWREPYEE